MYKTSGDFRAEARALLRGNWPKALIVCLIVWLVASSGDLLQTQTVEEIYKNGQVIHKVVEKKNSPLSIINFLFAGPAYFGLVAFYMNLKRKGQAEVGDILKGMDRFGRNFLTELLMTIFIALWTLLLIIPGIIAYYSYSMTWFILNDNPELTSSQAIARSKELMRGKKMALFQLQVSFIGWAILAYVGAIVTLGLSMVPLQAYYNAAKLSFYEDLINHEGISIEY